MVHVCTKLKVKLNVHVYTMFNLILDIVSTKLLQKFMLNKQSDRDAFDLRK